VDTPRPSPRTNRTRRVPHPVQGVAANAADDLDEVARRAFALAPADTIQALHSSVLLHTEGPSPPSQGYLILTTKHALWASSDFDVRHKIAWDGAAAEKRKSFMIRNNAIEITAAGGAARLFVSSASWTRDQVLSEEVLPLLAAAAAGAYSGVGPNLGAVATAAGGREEPSEAGAATGRASARQRTLTCRVAKDAATPAPAPGAGGEAAAYAARKARARDSITWTVMVLDAVSRVAGPERAPGGACLLELHAPWQVENPPPPSRTNWTRLVPPPVLTGRVSFLLPY